MNQYAVTVVIPIYNVEAFVKRCLVSAFSQTMPNIEYILVDDRGTDDSMKIAYNVINSSERKNAVRVIVNEKNIGAGSTRNVGIKYAAGKYVFFLDSDDMITNDAIEKLYNAAEKYQADLTIGSYTSVRFVESDEKWAAQLDEHFINTNEAVVQYYVSGAYYVMSWNKLYNRDFLLKNKIYCIDSSSHEDEFFSLQVAMTATSLVTIPDVTYVYSIRSGSTMTTFSEKNYEDYYVTILHMIDYAYQFKGTSSYPAIINFIYGFKNALMLKLQDDKRVGSRFKNEYKAKFGIKVLGFRDIVSMPSVRFSRKLKYCINFFDTNLQIVFLRTMVRMYKMMNAA